MKYSTIETMPGYEITDVLGVVTGNVVQSKHVGRDIMANLKSIVGGELKGYTEMYNEARSISIERMLEEARNLGADAVIGVRFTTSSVTEGASEVMAFGTAVTLHKH
ncbi:YbjQ family protein [Photobacterium damselae subsp. damselae]|uniref:YbjQ family protein n=1 Tax=Photobacterium damselae TaxID=38293 RepID=UPI001F2EA5D4|nr:YbjQ family protein [Photobacterium damselae]MCG3845042.1 heavy metal-binding domain-containing protein [Photobacterium damselae]UKA03442.1 heavy metal-binding domain-containing protein [Photobacterium damselae subsp. damselae]